MDGRLCFSRYGRGRPKLIVNEAEAANVRTMFELFARSDSTAAVIREPDARDIRSKRGRPIDRGALYKLLHNRIYRGEITHKDKAYPGEHYVIIDDDLWDEVMANNRDKRIAVARAPAPALLRGLIFTQSGTAMTPHHTKKGNRRYCHYVSMDVIRKRPIADLRGPQRLPAAMVEDAIIGEIRRLLRMPEIVARTRHVLRDLQPGIGPRSECLSCRPPDRLRSQGYSSPPNIQFIDQSVIRKKVRIQTFHWRQRFHRVRPPAQSMRLC